MKIAGYTISMQSRHEFKAAYAKSETLNVWRDKPPANNPKPPDGTIRQWLENELRISAQAREALLKQTQNVDEPSESYDVPELSDADKRKILILEKMLSALLGRKVKFRIPRRIHTGQAGRDLANLQVKIDSARQAQSEGGPAPVRQGWGFVYERRESYQENEKLSFNAAGIIKTADGREIDFEVQLNMSREFAANNDLVVKGGDALLDPLVINFDGPAARLTDTKYSFDLDADGMKDQISFLTGGSGFLALDLNNDRIINDGKELFGPATGNGFAELARYDQDQNGWIDENDAIFNKLRIWTKDADGKDTLFALGEKGVGAIFLGNIAAGFGMKNGTNELQGEAKTAGVFLKENGTPGIIQQLDLVV